MTRGDPQREAQHVLDELLLEDILQFKLTAFVVESIGHEEYIVRFRDSRLPSIDVSWPLGQTFKDVFRASLMQRLERMNSGHSHKTVPNDQTAQ
jgi:hypothetical protein